MNDTILSSLGQNGKIKMKLYEINLFIFVSSLCPNILVFLLNVYIIMIIVIWRVFVLQK